MLGRGHGTEPWDLFCSLSGFPSPGTPVCISACQRGCQGHSQGQRGRRAGKLRCRLHLHQQNFISRVLWMQMEKARLGAVVVVGALLSSGHLLSCLFCLLSVWTKLSYFQASAHWLSLCALARVGPLHALFSCPSHPGKCSSNVLRSSLVP